MSYKMKRRLVTVSIVVVFTMIMFFVLGSRDVCADTNLRVNERKFFTGYVVQSGDCLWNIAGEYITEEYVDRNEYIREVVASNQLESPDVYPGQLLLLPYYADEPRCGQ